jgi:hypothetical protein
VRADGRDVVFEVRVPASTRASFSATPLSNFDLALNLVSDVASCGSTASGLTCLAGRDNAASGDAESLDFVNAGPARSVWLIVDGYTGRDFGPFSLSTVFTPIPTGDTCEAPTLLTPGAALTAQALTGFDDDYGATFSGQCEFHGGVDRVYAVAVPAGQRLTTTVTPAGFDASLSLVRGAMNCGAETCAAGVDANGTSAAEQLVWDNLSTVAETVLLVVDADTGGHGTFSIQATLTTSPPLVTPGDTCAAPVMLDAGTFVGTTTGRASRFDFFDNGGCAASSAAPDGVFGVTVPPSSFVRTTVVPSGWDAVLEVLGSAGACGFTTDAGTLGATCLSSSDGPRTGSTEQVVVRNPGATPLSAFIVLDGHQDDAHGPFTLTTEVVPLAALAGDTCQAPQPLLASGMLQGLTTLDYLDDVENASSCSSIANRGPYRIFSIVVPAGKQLTAVVIPSGWDAALTLMDPASCGLSATCHDSSDTGLTSGAETARFTNSGTSDRTIFIVVDAYTATGAGAFDLFTSITP